MTRSDWQDGQRTLGMFLNGQEIATPGPRGERIVDDSFLLLFNSGHMDATFRLPNRRFGREWTLVLSTADLDAHEGRFTVEAHGKVPIMARSVIILRRVAD